MNILKNKKKIRYFFKKKNKNTLIKKKYVKKIISIIMKYKKFQFSKNIAIYYPNKNEINLIKLIKLNKKKNFFFPKIVSYKKKKIIFNKYTNNSIFYRNKFNILEINKKKHNYKLDIIFIPLTSFDIYGTRIGKGKGYYDKYLKKLKKKILYL